MSNTVENEQIRTARAGSTQSMVDQPGRVRAVHIVASGVAGNVAFRDGGSGGTLIAFIDTPASATETIQIEIPGGGVLFGTSLFATLSDVSFVTVFYAEDRTV